MDGEMTLSPLSLKFVMMTACCTDIDFVRGMYNSGSRRRFRSKCRYILDHEQTLCIQDSRGQCVAQQNSYLHAC